jgi:hypothetical protein
MCCWKSVSSPTNQRFETEAYSTAICRTEQIALSNLATALAGMKTGINRHPTGHRCPMAPGGVQVVLDVVLTASDLCEKKICRQTTA